MIKMIAAVTAWVLLSASVSVVTVSQTASKPAAAPAPASIRTVATVKQLMHIAVIPSSDAVFKAAGEPPKTDDAWSEVRDCALALAESGNLLMIGTRVQDRLSWLRFSRAMVDAAAGAAKAAEAKNADALSTASDQIYETCETCHAKYMKK